MKVFLCLAFLAATVAAVPVEDASRINGETGWYVPQWDGSVEWVDMAEGEKMLEQRAMVEGRDVSLWPVDYYLFTRANPTKGQQIKATAKSMDASNFNPKNPTRFVIHGWTQSYTSPMNKEITKAWLSRGDFNVIVVDWARARSLEYASSVIAVDTTGEKVAGFIDFLVKERGMSLSTLIVIGHSLGAHVSGYAGKNVKSGKVNTIVGLDTALPLFFYDKPAKRLASTDATYVESIHTNGGGLGFLRPIGKASFYPNGGESQPGCTLDVTGACAHGRSTTYYAEGVELNNFPTIKCANYTDANKNKCGSTYSSTKMATANANPNTSGEFYVPVKSKSPHGMA